MTQNEELRIRNPFLDPLVSELIEDPDRYQKMFSERILVGETLQVFQPANVVLTGTQGSGKSMILNLLRYTVLAQWFASEGALPNPLHHIKPFFGISVNLVRANFHVFGRRSVSKARGGIVDQGIDTTCAADYLAHYLFREFLKGVEFLLSREGNRLRDWLGITRQKLQDEIRPMCNWSCWYGYYAECTNLDELLDKSDRRLTIWRKFLNANIDVIPEDVWETKCSMEDSLHSMGNVLRSVGPYKERLSLYVVIDQYEVLPELNTTHGTSLQRIVNSLIKSRDPVVFYKIGARTYDWGQELRIWGAESRIEVQRDYAIVNLLSVLMRGEDSRGWLFPEFAKDVAFKRMKEEGYDEASEDQIQKTLGKWYPDAEARLYFKNPPRKTIVLRRISERLVKAIENFCGKDASPLELRLAGAWALQRQQRGELESQIIDELGSQPWQRRWWRKERVGVALLQIASFANQRKLYYGWDTIVYLSGSNITAFLMLCGEIWDVAAKLNVHPLRECPLDETIQTDGVFTASSKWANRDRVEQIGGRKRYEVLSRLGPAIRDALIGDLAISNPGHSGFSLRESDLWADRQGKEVARFIESAVSWAFFEERPHTPKQKESATRRKWYLFPLLSPTFGIPHIRVKEPLYADINEVYKWIFGNDKIIFRNMPHHSSKHRQHKRKVKSSAQLNLLGGR